MLLCKVCDRQLVNVTSRLQSSVASSTFIVPHPSSLHVIRAILNDNLALRLYMTSACVSRLKTIDEYVEKFLDDFNEQVQELSSDKFDKFVSHFFL